MVVTGWRAALLIVVGLIIVAALLIALFWLGLGLAALAAVVWFNLVLLPRLAARSRIPELVLAAALMPLLAGAGLALAGTGGLVAGCAIWLLGVALPRALLWRFRRRLERQRQVDPSLHPVRIIDADFTSRTSGY
jgi:hypothetical protein